MRTLLSSTLQRRLSPRTHTYAHPHPHPHRFPASGLAMVHIVKTQGQAPPNGPHTSTLLEWAANHTREQGRDPVKGPAAVSQWKDYAAERFKSAWGDFLAKPNAKVSQTPYRTAKLVKCILPTCWYTAALHDSARQRAPPAHAVRDMPHHLNPGGPLVRVDKGHLRECYAVSKGGRRSAGTGGDERDRGHEEEEKAQEEERRRIDSIRL